MNTSETGSKLRRSLPVIPAVFFPLSDPDSSLSSCSQDSNEPDKDTNPRNRTRETGVIPPSNSHSKLSSWCRHIVASAASSVSHHSREQKEVSDNADRKRAASVVATRRNRLCVDPNLFVPEKSLTTFSMSTWNSSWGPGQRLIRAKRSRFFFTHGLDYKPRGGWIEALTTLRRVSRPLRSQNLRLVRRAARALGALQAAARDPYPPQNLESIDVHSSAALLLLDELRFFFGVSISVYPPAHVRQHYGMKLEASDLVESVREFLTGSIEPKNDDCVIVDFLDKADIHRPAYCLVVDNVRQLILLIIRGSSSFSDVATDIQCVVVRETRTHDGMERAACWFDHQLRPIMMFLCATYPHYRVTLCGHSLGGGVCSLLAVKWLAVEAIAGPGPERSRLKAYSYGAPAVHSWSLADNFREHIYSVTNGRDIIARLSQGSVINMTNILLHICKQLKVNGQGEMATSAKAAERKNRTDVGASILTEARQYVEERVIEQAQVFQQDVHDKYTSAISSVQHKVRNLNSSVLGNYQDNPARVDGGIGDSDGSDDDRHESPDFGKRERPSTGLLGSSWTEWHAEEDSTPHRTGTRPRVHSENPVSGRSSQHRFGSVGIFWKKNRQRGSSKEMDALEQNRTVISAEQRCQYISQFSPRGDNEDSNRGRVSANGRSRIATPRSRRSPNTRDVISSAVPWEPRWREEPKCAAAMSVVDEEASFLPSRVLVGSERNIPDSNAAAEFSDKGLYLRGLADGTGGKSSRGSDRVYRTMPLGRADWTGEGAERPLDPHTTEDASQWSLKSLQSPQLRTTSRGNRLPQAIVKPAATANLRVSSGCLNHAPPTNGFVQANVVGIFQAPSPTDPPAAVNEDNRFLQKIDLLRGSPFNVARAGDDDPSTVGTLYIPCTPPAVTPRIGYRIMIHPTSSHSITYQSSLGSDTDHFDDDAAIYLSCATDGGKRSIAPEAVDMLVGANIVSSDFQQQVGTRSMAAVPVAINFPQPALNLAVSQLNASEAPSVASTGRPGHDGRPGRYGVGRTTSCTSSWVNFVPKGSGSIQRLRSTRVSVRPRTSSTSTVLLHRSKLPRLMETRPLVGAATYCGDERIESDISRPASTSTAFRKDAPARNLPSRVFTKDQKQMSRVTFAATVNGEDATGMSSQSGISSPSGLGPSRLWKDFTGNVRRAWQNLNPREEKIETFRAALAKLRELMDQDEHTILCPSGRWFICMPGVHTHRQPVGNLLPGGFRLYDASDRRLSICSEMVFTRRAVHDHYPRFINFALGTNIKMDMPEVLADEMEQSLALGNNFDVPAEWTLPAFGMKHRLLRARQQECTTATTGLGMGWHFPNPLSHLHDLATSPLGGGSVHVASTSIAATADGVKRRGRLGIPALFAQYLASYSYYPLLTPLPSPTDEQRLHFSRSPHWIPPKEVARLRAIQSRPAGSTGKNCTELPATDAKILKPPDSTWRQQETASPFRRDRGGKQCHGRNLNGSGRNSSGSVILQADDIATVREPVAFPGGRRRRRFFHRPRAVPDSSASTSASAHEYRRQDRRSLRCHHRPGRDSYGSESEDATTTNSCWQRPGNSSKRDGHAR